MAANDDGIRGYEVVLECFFFVSHYTKLNSLVYLRVESIQYRVLCAKP